MTYTEKQLEESAKRIKRQFTQKWYDDPMVWSILFLVVIFGVIPGSALILKFMRIVN